MGFPKSHHVSYYRFTVKFTRRRAHIQWHFIYLFFFFNSKQTAAGCYRIDSVKYVTFSIQTKFICIKRNL